MKIVVVGNEGVGKTKFIRRLMSSHESQSPVPSPVSSSASLLSELYRQQQQQEQQSTSSIPETHAVGLDVYEWNLPSTASSTKDDGLKRLAVWDFTGHESFHSIQELFFTPETLFVVVWDMAAKEIPPTEQQRACAGSGTSTDSASAGSSPGPLSSSCGGDAKVPRHPCSSSSAFKLGYDSDSDSDDGCDMDLYNQEEIRRAKRALDQDIDHKVQFWIDRIQARVPGATILPVATFADRFWTLGTACARRFHEDSHTLELCSKEAKKRCKSLKERLLCNEHFRVQDLERRLKCVSSSAGDGSECDSHQQTFHWIKSLSNRPKILFGCIQEDGQALSHQVSAVEDVGFGNLRAFLLSSARVLAASEDTNLCSASYHARTVARDVCCRMKNSQFKAVQAVYFRKQCSNELSLEEQSDGVMRATLGSLHRSGELCFFGDGSKTIHSNIVVLDPSWMVGCIDFFLGYVLKRSSRSQKSDLFPLSLLSIEEEEIKLPWKNSAIFRQALGPVDSPSVDSNQFLNFLVSFLVQNDVFVPLSFLDGAGPNRFFLPSLLSQQDCLNWNVPNLSGSSLSLQRASELFSKSLCHGMTFMDTIPPTLMERITVHTIKMLSVVVSSSKAVVKEFLCGKDSCHIKLGMAVNDGERIVEVQNFLLQSSEDDCTSSCSAASCRSMFVTCIQGCLDESSRKLWHPVCWTLHKGTKTALDEISGIEYREEGACPDCLEKKAVGEVGTWSLVKIKSVLDDGETVIRCRHGHCIDTKLVRGLIECLVDVPETNPGSTSVPCDLQPSSSSDVAKDVQPAPSLPAKQKKELLPFTSKACRNMGAARLSRGTSASSSEESLDRDETSRRVKKAIEECQTSTKKRFFGRKKSRLVLSNLGLKENDVPVNALYQTPLGINLHTLSLTNNHLETIPSQLALCLPNLKCLDLSHCFIYDLPKKWSLPKLKKLNVSHNLLISFPSAVSSYFVRVLI